MSKHEAPPFRMVVEKGRLVPASAYDAERLDSYRNGTKVRVRFVEEKDRILVRKWWAVLGLVVKQCNVPWKTKDEASEAIKLALGVVNLTKTVGGDFLAYPKSLTELDDVELADTVDKMMALIQRLTGIDPDTLRKEIADIGEDESEQVSGQSSPDDLGDDADRPTAGVVATDTPQDGGPTEEDAPATSEPDKPADGPKAASSSELSDADLDWLKSVARDLWGSTALGEQETVSRSFADRRATVPPDVSQQARAKAIQIVRFCKEVCFGEMSASHALPLIANIAGCEPRDITAPGAA